jgi:RNA polymerase sigma-70 factor (sigma-E family)
MPRAEAPSKNGPTPDDPGFVEWVTARGTPLRRKAYLLCGDWDRADDLVQDTLVYVFARWGRVARGSNVDAYVNRVLVHKAVDEGRKPWRRVRLVEHVPEVADHAAGAALVGVEHADSPLALALAELPVGQRAVLVLRYTDDLSVEEIARVLDLPSGTVKSRLSRAVQAVRSHLETQGLGVSAAGPEDTP